MGDEVDYQEADDAATRTPNVHRAKIAQQKSADGRMATEAAWLKGRDSQEGKRKTSLTLTGLLMEGLGLGGRCPCRSLLKVHAAEQVLEARVRAQRIEYWVVFDAHPQSCRSFHKSLFQPLDCLLFLPESSINLSPAQSSNIFLLR